MSAEDTAEYWLFPTSTTTTGNLSEAERALSDLDVCEELLQRTQQVGQVSLEEDRLTGPDKVQYIKYFIVYR